MPPKVEFLRRPAVLAQDISPVMDVIKHALDNHPGYDYLVLLQPTSPLRLTSDIDACIERADESGKACVSVVRPKHHPAWIFPVKEGKLLVENYTDKRRQDLPKVYELNGAVYVASIKYLKLHGTFVTEQTYIYEMPEERSIDIDTAADFHLAEWYMAQNDRKIA